MESKPDQNTSNTSPSPGAPQKPNAFNPYVSVQHLTKDISKMYTSTGRAFAF